MVKKSKEEYWMSYLSYYTKVYHSLADVGRNDLLDEDVPEDIKIVVVSLFRDHAKEWLNSNLPALGDRKPIDLLKTEEGLEALKGLLLRIPE